MVSALDWICAVLLALLPILQHYRGLLGFVASAFLNNILPAHYINLADNMSISLMILMAPYLAVRFFACLKEKNFKGLLLVSPLIAFYIYKVIDHGTSVAELLQVGLSIGYLVCLGMGCIDLKKFLKAATVIACVAAVGLIAQYVCYYIFDFHLQLVPDRFLLPSAEQWVLGVRTGRYSVTGNKTLFYRTAAIFLEPSHLLMYTFPLLPIKLYQKEKKLIDWITSGLMALSLVLSTSGMGLAVVFCVLVLFAMLWNEKNGEITLTGLKKGKNWLRGICTALVLLILFLNIPSINSSMAHIIGRKQISISMFFPSQSVQPNQGGTVDGNDTMPNGETMPDDWIETSPEETEPQMQLAKPIVAEKNAVSGRVKGAIKILKNMNVRQWIIGCSDSTAGTNTNMPGFMAIAYKYGIIGLLLSYAFFAFGLVKFGAGYFWATVIWFIVSFFSTHTHGMIYILFYIMLFYGGYEESTRPWIMEFKDVFRFRKAK